MQLSLCDSTAYNWRGQGYLQCTELSSHTAGGQGLAFTVKGLVLHISNKIITDYRRGLSGLGWPCWQGLASLYGAGGPSWQGHA